MEGYDRVDTCVQYLHRIRWRDAERAGVYRGSAVDVKDGFIHFSTAEQAAETAAKWFARQRDLVLVAVDADALGDKLKWEPSRGGALFPHLYGELSLKAVQRVDPLPLDETGRHGPALRSLMFVEGKGMKANNRGGGALAKRNRRLFEN